MKTLPSNRWHRRGNSIVIDDEAAIFRPDENEIIGRARVRKIKTVNPQPMGRHIVRATITGFNRYRNELASLPPTERGRIDQLARVVVDTHQRRQYPINSIRVIGHADFDTPRRPIFETKVSDQRANSIALALRAAIDRYGVRLAHSGAPLSRRIRWQRFGMGATIPAVKQPRTEAERLRNRRVDILLEAERRQAPSMPAMTFISARQRALVAQVGQPVSACTVPSPEQKAAVSRGPNTRFNASVSALAFNPTTVGFIQQVKVPGSDVITAMRFSCHRVLAGARCLDVVPAWRFGADFSVVLPDSEPFGDWEMGFMQTVASSNIRHVYTRGTRQCIIASPTRDAIAGSPLPWFDARFVHALDAGRNPVIEDSPRTTAQIRHPVLGELRQVCLEGVYQIWLAVRKAKPAGAPILLVFKEIQVRRNWTLISGRSAEDSASWVHRGSQCEIRRGDGNSAQLPRPVLTNPTANDSVATCFRDIPGAVSLCPPDAVPEFPNLKIIGVTCPA